MSSLLAFGCFADDPQSVLAAVQRLAVVGIERSFNLGVCAAKLRTTTFADGEGRILFHDPQFSLRHEDSLPPFACANETAPVPWSYSFLRHACGAGISLSDGVPSRKIMTEPDATFVACSDCAAQMPSTAAFCPSCGRSMLENPTPGNPRPENSMPDNPMPEESTSALSRAQGRVGIFSEGVAGALAYVTFIPAVVFLLCSPYNRNSFVRFHSVQCLLFWLASASMAAAIRLAALVVILIPTLGPLLITLVSVVFTFALIVTWAVLVVKAFQGETFELPVLGILANRYANTL